LDIVQTNDISEEMVYEPDISEFEDENNTKEGEDKDNDVNMEDEHRDEDKLVEDEVNDEGISVDIETILTTANAAALLGDFMPGHKLHYKKFALRLLRCPYGTRRQRGIGLPVTLRALLDNIMVSMADPRHLCVS
jgi:hypothetical protein